MVFRSRFIGNIPEEPKEREKKREESLQMIPQTVICHEQEDVQSMPLFDPNITDTIHTTTQ